MPSPRFPIDEAYLIGGWAESFLWGCFTFLFFTTLYTTHVKNKRPVNFTISAMLMLYLLATAHMILALIRLIQGFVAYRETIGPARYFAQISTRINLAKDYIYITNLVLGDAVIVWRLYAVWARDIRMAIFPVLLVVAEAVTGYASCSLELFPNARYETVALWGTLMYSMSLVTNILVTAVVAFRIWYVSRSARLAGLGGVNYTKLLFLLIESGALITSAKVVEFVLFQYVPADSAVHGMNALYIVYECMPQITGIVPTLIVWAVNNGYTQPDEYHMDSTVDLAFATSTQSETTAVPSSSTFSFLDAAKVGEATVETMV
ncbi:hypothetical protein OH77DRAFT_1394313 [Trametes cingulata]|nr:hypothetical protein OH77DRAFT_1394313 [Trametes cingulata]